MSLQQSPSAEYFLDLWMQVEAYAMLVACHRTDGLYYAITTGIDAWECVGPVGNVALVYKNLFRLLCMRMVQAGVATLAMDWVM